MINVDLKPLLKNDISRYSLVVAASKRARVIAEDAKRDNISLIEKPVSLAVQDFLTNKYSIVESEEINEF